MPREHLREALLDDRRLHAQELVDRDDQWGIAHDADLAVLGRGEPVEGPHAVLLLGLHDALSKFFAWLRPTCRAVLLQSLHVETLVPDVDRPHRGEPAHLLPIFPSRGGGCGPSLASLQPDRAAADRRSSRPAASDPIRNGGPDASHRSRSGRRSAAGRGQRKPPKLERCASPQSWTLRPELGVVAKSAAMIAAPPR